MPIDGPAPAVINALRHAGYDLREIPATPEKIMASARNRDRDRESLLAVEAQRSGERRGRKDLATDRDRESTLEVEAQRSSVRRAGVGPRAK